MNNDIKISLGEYENYSYDEQIEAQEAILKKETFLAKLNRDNNVWGHSPMANEAKKASMAMLSTKTGLYASIPILCKEDTCPYANTCDLLINGLTDKGQKCAWECAIVETRYAGYSRDFDLGNETTSFTDQLLIVDLIKADVMIERATRLIAQEGTPVSDVVAGISESGQEFTRPEISKAVEVLEKHNNIKYKILDLMNATRKAKRGTGETQASIYQMIGETLETTEFIIEEKPDHFK